jgi:hypothetical protein
VGGTCTRVSEPCGSVREAGRLELADKHSAACLVEIEHLLEPLFEVAVLRAQLARSRMGRLPVDDVVAVLVQPREHAVARLRMQQLDW